MLCRNTLRQAVVSPLSVLVVIEQTAAYIREFEHNIGFNFYQNFMTQILKFFIFVHMICNVSFNMEHP
jgi:hypothetical protein